MKLIICDRCHDIIALDYAERRCKCGDSGGRYLNHLIAEVGGPCRVIGIENGLRYGTMKRAEAWLIPEPHDRIARSEAPRGGAR